jgi:hypothetical protein
VIVKSFLRCLTYKNDYSFCIEDGVLKDSFLNIKINPNPSMLFAEMLTECLWNVCRVDFDFMITSLTPPTNENIVNDFNNITKTCYLRHTVGDQETYYHLKDNSLYLFDKPNEPVKITELLLIDGDWTIVKEQDCR